MPMSFAASLIRFRILPVTIMMSVMLFGVKLYDVVQGTNQLSELLIAGPAVAVAPEEENTEAMSAEDEKALKESAIAGSDGEAVSDEAGDDEMASAEETDRIDQYLSSKEAKRRFTQIEIDILQSLSERRKKLEKWEDEVQMKENLLEATELRINKKIEEVKSLDKIVRQLLSEYKVQEDAKIRSLVKIYENMKPKQAARIFDEIELPVLLMVVDKMSERKAAPILAKMDPIKAKEVTVELAEQRRLFNQSKDALDKMN